MAKLVYWLLALTSCISALPATSSSSAAVPSPTVDLGYGVYEGYYNTTSGLNIFKGIRYAAAPTGQLRWAKPVAPSTNRTLTPATAWPPRCPQSPQAPLPGNYNFTQSGLGSEDCLFLSVFAPPAARDLPVLVWIHGGGYGTGQGNTDLSEMMSTNANGFITVAIQYRLGAFGFLSSAEMKEAGGTVNAGLWDMLFALQWVRDHIGKFGGNSDRVTISGESSGGGAVMALSMAMGGSLGTGLWRNAIVASPYLPMVWDYDGAAPERAYEMFAEAVGCARGGKDDGQRTFECLRNTDTVALQNASAHVSAGGLYGHWQFLPVTDGEFLMERPTEQLLKGKVNGARMLSGNNADEGPVFVPQNLTTESSFDVWLSALLPLMNASTLARVQQTYAISAPVAGQLYSTLGDVGPTALNQSNFAVGQQQRANNLYAETTFVCPSYWLATAFSRKDGEQGKAWKYQFSVPPAEHGADLDAYYAFNREALGEGTMSEAFRRGVQLIWGRFVIYDNPTLPVSVVRNLTVDAVSGAGTGDDLSAGQMGVWPEWVGQGKGGYQMLNLNMTGGHLVEVTETYGDGTSQVLTQYAGPGREADWRVVDAYVWEGGRGARCDFWAEVGSVVPE